MPEDKVSIEFTLETKKQEALSYLSINRLIPVSLILMEEPTNCPWDY